MSKFDIKKDGQKEIAVEVLVKAYQIYERGKKTKIQAVEEAVRPYRNKNILPVDDTMVDALTDIIEQKKIGELLKDKQRKSSRNVILNEVLKELGIKEPEPEKEEPAAEEQIPGQICMELQEAEPKKAEEPLDMTPLMRLIAGKAGEILKATEMIQAALEMLHNDITKMDDHLCQVLRRTDG